MFRSKQDVDRHVSALLSKLKTEKERYMKGYAIARLYHDVKEYEIAKRHLTCFMSVKDNYAPAYKLLAKIHERQNLREKALQAYKRCIELDDKEHDVLLKICDIYSEVDVDMDRASYWVERAERIYPRNNSVFRLKERLCSKDCDATPNNEELEDLLTTELTRRPKDPDLRVKLVQLYLDTNRVNEAYDHVTEVERKNVYSDSIVWYRHLQKVLEVFKEKSGSNLNGAYHRTLLHVHNQLCALTLQQSRVVESADTIHAFDHLLHTLMEGKQGAGVWPAFLREMQAQLYFHAGTMVLKRAMHDRLGWREASDLAGLCYLTSYSVEPFSTQADWFVNAPEHEKVTYERLYRESCHRCSQTGHMIKQLAADDRAKWLARIKQQHATSQGWQHLYRTLFTTSSARMLQQTSCLLQSALTSQELRLPAEPQMQDWDAVAQLVRPDDLQLLVWLALQWHGAGDRTQMNYGFTVFEELQFSTRDLNDTTPESLSQLDTETFLYAVVRCAAVRQQQRMRHMAGTLQPALLPLSLCAPLVSNEQKEWWLTAYKLYRNLVSDQQHAQARRTLLRGLEVVRMVGFHGMHVRLVVHLARTWEERARDAQENCDVTEGCEGTEVLTRKTQHLQARAHHCWTVAVEQLDRLKQSKSLLNVKNPLFDMDDDELEASEILEMLDEGRYFLAKTNMTANRRQVALEQFSKLYTPHASFHEAKIYLMYAKDEIGEKSRDTLSPSQRENYKALLTKARDKCYDTVDRLKGDKFNPLNTELLEEIDDIESRLNNLAFNPDNNPDEEDPDRSVTPQLPPQTGLSFRESVLQTSTPAVGRSLKAQNDSLAVNVSRCDSAHRHERVRPSPEKLELQMRSLARSHDDLLKSVLEKNDAVLEQNRVIVQELQANRMQLERMKVQIDQYHQMYHHLLAAQLHGSPLGLMGATGHIPGGHMGPGVPMGMPHAMAGMPGMPPPRMPPQHCYPGGMNFSSQLQNPPHQAAPAAGVSHTYSALSQAIGSGGPSPAQPPPRYHAPADSAASTAGEEEDIVVYENGQVHPGGGQQDWQAGGPPSTTGPGYGPAVVGAPAAPGMFSGAGAAYRPPPPLIGPAPGQSPLMPGLLGQSPLASMGAMASQYGLGSVQAEAVTGSSLIKMPGQGQAQITSTAAFNTPYPITFTTVAGQAPKEPIDSGDAAAGKPLSFAVGSPDKPAVTTSDGAAASEPFRFNLSQYKPNTDKDVTAEEEDEDDGVYVDGDDHSPDFKPVVALPEVVELNTGEENETVIFEHRAKLLRFVDKEWKERGLGDIKILHNQATDQVRIVMRREHVFKVCANHYIKPDTAIDYFDEPHKGKNKKVLTWRALDFSDEESRPHVFCCRFKEDTIAAKFKEAFEKGKVIAAKYQSPEKAKTDSAAKSNSLAAKFAAKPGQWECTACLVRNESDVTKCVSCQSQKPGTSPEKPAAVSGSVGSTTYGFTFGGASSAGANQPSFGSLTFGSAKGTTSTPAAASIPAPSAAATDSSKGKSELTFGGFSFTSQPTVTKPAEPKVENKDKAKDKTEQKPPNPFASFAFGAKPEAEKKPAEEKPAPAETKPQTQPQSKPQPTKQSLAAKFAIQPGEWNCDVCAVRNKSGTTACAACATPKPGCEEEQPAAPAQASGAVRNLFGNTAGAQSGFTFGSTDSGFTFGGNTVNVCEPSSGFKFGNQRTEQKTQDGVKTTPPKFQFGSATTFSFTGVTPTTSPSKGHKVQSPEDPQSPELYHTEEGDDGIYFEPICQLPQNVSISTGEEEEQVLYCHRAKLFRFTDGEWKERGLGNVKILMNDATQKIRLLMRREQIHKLCMNHQLHRDIMLKPMPNAQGKAWIWHADDFSEGESRHEQFAIKFKDQEIADSFKAAVDDAQRRLSENDFTKVTKDAEGHQEKTPVADAETISQQPTTQKSPGDKGFVFGSPAQSLPGFGQTTFSFGQQQGVTSQPGAFSFAAAASGEAASATQGGLLATLLEAPTSPKSGKSQIAANFGALDLSKPTASASANEDEDDDVIFVKEVLPSADKLKKAEEMNLSRTFYLYETKTAGCPGCIGCEHEEDKFDFVTGKLTSPLTTTAREASASTTASTAASPTFVQSQSATSQSSTSQASTSQPSTSFFSAPSSSLSFSALASETPAFGFGNTSGDSAFRFSGTGASVFGRAPPAHGQGDEAGDDEVVPSADIHFEPLVRLEEVELRTGEEDEDLVYNQRSKVYRYDRDVNQWKERGVGEIKILRHHETGKYRMLLRREQVHKLVLNQQITREMELKAMASSEKAWCWYATDFSEEDEGRVDQFAVRFKNEDQAKVFKDKFHECQASLPTEEQTAASSSTAHTEAKPPAVTSLQPPAQEQAVSSANDESFASARDDVQAADDAAEAEAAAEAEDDEDDDEYETDDEPEFVHRCTVNEYVDDAWKVLGLGEIQIVNDDDLSAYRIIMSDDKDVMHINHIIAKENSIKTMAKKHCEWTAMDFASDEGCRRTFRVQFSSANTNKEFTEKFKDGVALAEDNDISEKLDSKNWF